MRFSTPVVLLIFRRPDLTEQVFEQIRLVKPAKLLVVADGPRDQSEAEICNQTRAIVENVDWDCEVSLNFSDVNLGCRKRISSGLNWVFSQVDEAIILEDDCLPSLCFFDFCQSLIDKYRYDQRIMAISGNNMQLGKTRTSYSYYFSKYFHSWGWATWKRAWQYFDVDMKTWPEFIKDNLIDFCCEDFYEKKYWLDIFQRVYEKQINTSWDYQWLYAIWGQSGLTIIPDVNLVSNIGFGEDATHTTVNSPFSNLPSYDIPLIEHPSFVIRNSQADQFTFDYEKGGHALRIAHTLPARIQRRVNSLLAKIY
jgi:hypothetical protein